MILFLLPTISLAQVKAIDSKTASLTQADLEELVTQVVENKAKAEALQETVDSERALFESYTAQVDQLVEIQRAERESMLDVIKAKLRAPSLELYGGYTTDNDWEGGIRLVWKLK